MDWPPELDKVIPAVGGSLVSVVMQRGGALARGVLTFFSGVYLAYTFGETAAFVMNSSERVGTATIAIFGAAVVAKMLDTIAGFDGVKAGRELWLAALKRLRG